jgi:hypothetical protein
MAPPRPALSLNGKVPLMLNLESPSCNLSVVRNEGEGVDPSVVLAAVSLAAAAIHPIVVDPLWEYELVLVENVSPPSTPAALGPSIDQLPLTPEYIGLNTGVT